MMQPLRYELIRSARKTLAISVDGEGRLVVRAPLWTPQPQIESFLVEKRPWIDRICTRIASLPPPETLIASDGATFPFLGRFITLRYAQVCRASLSGDTLLLPHSAAAGDSASVVRWLEAQARKELPIRIAALSRQFGFRPTVFRLSRAKGRWGSMSGRGTLSLNRALMLCPPDIVDYVILHELCHIPQPNHSSAFWAQVEGCLPDYKVRRDWLKAHNALIFYLPD